MRQSGKNHAVKLPKTKERATIIWRSLSYNPIISYISINIRVLAPNLDGNLALNLDIRLKIEEKKMKDK